VREFEPTIIPGQPLKVADDPEYLVEFDNRFWRNILNNVSKFGLIDKSKIYFCLDCPRKQIWRRDHFPSYKISRDSTQHEKAMDFSGIFNYVKDSLIPNLKEKYDVKTISAPAAEGDDIIAVCVEACKNEYNIVIASDHDLIQLCDRAKIINIQGKMLELEEDIDREEFVMIKAIVGDGSDEIPQVFPRVGEGTAKKLVKDRQKLKKKLDENPDAMAAFKRNLLLMDLHRIPQIVQQNILERFEPYKGESVVNL